MNTFLPFPDFGHSAAILDTKRLGKQRVEAWQILNALGGNTKGWVNHPATKLWAGHEYALCLYGIAMCDEWIARGYKDTMKPRFVLLMGGYSDTGMPPWLGNEKFHLSHQSNLVRKAPSHYLFFFNPPPDLPYEWTPTYVQRESATVSS